MDPLHIPALKDMLRRVAYFTTRLQPVGISIRFLNHDEGDGRRYDDLVDVDDIAKKVDSVPYSGNTRLGQVLNEKIVQPMIIDKIIEGKLERPVFVVIITDGKVRVVTILHIWIQSRTLLLISTHPRASSNPVAFSQIFSQPTAEPAESLRNTIRNCKDVLSRHSYRDAAAIFLISQIGTDVGATTFLRSLETDPQISSMVFCSTENLAAKLERFQSSRQDKQYYAWVSVKKPFF